MAKHINVLGKQQIEPITINVFKYRCEGKLNIQPIIITRKIIEAKKAITPKVKVKISFTVKPSCKVRICKKRNKGKFSLSPTMPEKKQGKLKTNTLIEQINRQKNFLQVYIFFIFYYSRYNTN